MKLAHIPWVESLFCLGFGILCSWLTFRTGSWMFAAMAGLTLSAGVLFLKRNGWAHLVTAAVLALCIVGFALPDVIMEGITLRRSLILAMCGWGFWNHVAAWRRLRTEGLFPPPMNTIVLLLDQPAAMDVGRFQQVLKRAWDIDAEISTEGDIPMDRDAGGNQVHIILGKPPQMLLFSAANLWAMHSIASPYWDDPDAIAEGCSELRMEHAILKHKAWISFDCIGGEDISRTQVYEKIGKIIAECVDEHALGVVIPEEGQFIPASDDLVDQLRAPMPLQGLQNTPYAPVINVEDSDKAMKKAVSTAKERWPEFKAAFAERKTEQSFSVKVPITVGDNTEFIWVNIDQIANGTVSGTLGNEPVDLGDLVLGSSVSFPETAVNDWAYTKGDDFIGLFSANTFSPDIEEYTNE